MTVYINDYQSLYDAMSDVYRMGDIADDILSNHDMADEAREKLHEIVMLCDYSLRSIANDGEWGHNLVVALNENDYCKRHDI